MVAHVQMMKNSVMHQTKQLDAASVYSGEENYSDQDKVIVVYVSQTYIRVDPYDKTDLRPPTSPPPSQQFSLMIKTIEKTCFISFISSLSKSYAQKNKEKYIFIDRIHTDHIQSRSNTRGRAISIYLRTHQGELLFVREPMGPMQHQGELHAKIGLTSAKTTLLLFCVQLQRSREILRVARPAQTRPNSQIPVQNDGRAGLQIKHCYWCWWP